MYALRPLTFFHKIAITLNCFAKVTLNVTGKWSVFIPNGVSST